MASCCLDRRLLPSLPVAVLEPLGFRVRHLGNHRGPGGEVFNATDFFVTSWLQVLRAHARSQRMQAIPNLKPATLVTAPEGEELSREQRRL